MNDSPNNQIVSDLTPGLLKAKWDSITIVAGQIADEVDIKSDGLGGNFRKQALAVSQFFRGDCKFQDALNQSCVLAIANPLARMIDESKDGEASQSDLATAVHLGLCTLSRHGSNHRNLFRIFLYPIMLTYFVGLGGIFVSHFVLLPFTEMFAEFGITLPLVTSWVLSVGYLVRTYTMTILMVLFGLPPLFWLINWIGQEKREPGMSRFDLMLATQRPTVARWLLHVSLLMEAGESWADSIQRASAASGKTWIKRRAAAHARNLESESLEASRSFFDQKKFAMADTAILAMHSRGQVTLLQQVATWYRDTSANILEWIVQMLIPVYVFAILFGVFVLVMSMFAPLFSIFSGLTGGGPGGFF